LPRRWWWHGLTTKRNCDTMLYSPAT